MRVIIFAGYYYPHIGGYEKNIHELSKRLVGKGHQVAVITCNTDSAKTKEVKDGVAIFRLPAWNLMNKTFPLPKPMSLSNIPKGDVAITQTRFFPTSLIGMLYARKNNIPLIHVERGTKHSVVQNKIFSLLIQSYDHLLGKAVVKSAKVNIGVSQSACEFVHHIGGNNARVIYNGVHFFRKSDDDVTDICFVGRLIYAKGVQDLIKAFEKSCETHKDIRLIIVGDGNYKYELEKQASKSKYRSNIVFYGTQDHESVVRILMHSDMFINPSYSEGLPTSVMEAASCGKPVIATDVGGTNEIITDKVSGILVKPHDIDKLTESIKWVLDNPLEARKLGIQALHDSMDKFSWDKIVDQYENILKEVTR